jgi:hypothetical protein
MKARSLILLFAAAVTALPILTGCSSGYAEVYTDVPPPAVIVEDQGIAPGPDHVWIHGYHRWDGHHYNWNKGRWERRPRAEATWEDGRWEKTERGWRWYDGRWR